MPAKDPQQKKKDTAKLQSAASAAKVTNPIDADRLKLRDAEAAKEGAAPRETLAEGKERRLFGEAGAPGGEAPKGGIWTGAQGSQAAKKAKDLGLQGKRVITGGRYGDTFGADRINSGTTGGGDITGSKNDQVSTTFRADAENDPSTIVKQGPKAERLNAEAAVKAARQKEIDAFFQKEARDHTILPPEEGRPSTEQDEGGVWVPTTQSELKGQKKGIAARKGKAGGGDDPRVDNETGEGGNAAVPIGKDDRPVAERASGKINMDKVLEINTKINPGR